jgi:hypothetical protein
MTPYPFFRYWFVKLWPLTVLIAAYLLLQLATYTVTGHGLYPFDAPPAIVFDGTSGEQRRVPWWEKRARW